MDLGEKPDQQPVALAILIFECGDNLSLYIFRFTIKLEWWMNEPKKKKGSI